MVFDAVIHLQEKFFNVAKGAVEELVRLASPAIFKIGITCNPPARWCAYVHARRL